MEEVVCWRCVFGFFGAPSTRHFQGRCHFAIPMSLSDFVIITVLHDIYVCQNYVIVTKDTLVRPSRRACFSLLNLGELS
jgi:hypothetical protein